MRTLSEDYESRRALVVVVGRRFRNLLAGKVQGRSDPFAVASGTALVHAPRIGRRVNDEGDVAARGTPRAANSMADMSDERPAKIPRVPTKMRSARRSGGAAAIVTELCAVTDEEPPTLSSAGASNASTLCETPGGARPAPEDALPASDAAVGSAQGGASPNGDGDAMPPPRPPARVGSLPHLNLHINIPSNPTTPLEYDP